jgi:cytochrome c oxidase subunit 2
MLHAFSLFPRSASNFSGRVDALFFFLVGVSAFFAGLIFLLIIVFAIKYRRRSPDEQPKPIHGNLALELIWTIIPLGLTLVMFVWGAWLFVAMSEPPADAINIYVVGKQWMWKFQHQEGNREIDALHIPVGRPIKLTMTSEDVIHSFFIPAFRVKKDVLPGRYTTLWFTASKVGEYQQYCTQYCGTGHAGMLSKIYVMEPAAYEKWLHGGEAPPSAAPAAPAQPVSLAAQGEQLFNQFGCSSCHLPSGKGPGPSLLGVFGKPVKLTSGQTITADETYLRQHILTPGKTVVAGYPPIMPTFKGRINEEQLVQLIAYIKSLASQAAK